MFWRSYNLKKAILKQLNPVLKPQCYISKIVTFPAKQFLNGDWKVFVYIACPCEIFHLGWSCGDVILDKKTLRIKHIDITAKESIFRQKTVIQEAEEIVGGK